MPSFLESVAGQLGTVITDREDEQASGQLPQIARCHDHFESRRRSGGGGIPVAGFVAYPGSFLIGLMGVVGQSACLFFAVPAGGVVDRVDRRKVLIRVTGFQFLVTLAVTAAFAGARDLAAPGTPETVPDAGLWLGVLFIAVLALNMAEVLRDTGAQSIVPALVGREQLERANGRLLSAEVIANHLVGQPLGGLLIAVALWARSVSTAPRLGWPHY